MAGDDFSVTIVGAGNMGGAMMAGWLRGGMAASRICVIDPDPSAAAGKIIADNAIFHATCAYELEKRSDVLLVAVKPRIMDIVLDSIKPLTGKSVLVISIVAGKTISSVKKALGACAVVRAMPNMPALVQRGVTVACGDVKVDRLQKRRAASLLGATGSVEWVDEEALMDAVTAVSGSGPAYVFYLVEVLGDAAIAAGLPEGLSRKLALETVIGAGELMRQSDSPPSVLRERVASVGGTTEAALSVLMGRDGFPELLRRTVNAAAIRSRELS